MNQKLEEMKKFLRDSPSISTSWDALGWRSTFNTTINAKICVVCHEDQNEMKGDVGNFQWDSISQSVQYFCWECWNASQECKRKMQ